MSPTHRGAASHHTQHAGTVTLHGSFYGSGQASSIAQTSGGIRKLQIAHRIGSFCHACTLQRDWLGIWCWRGRLLILQCEEHAIRTLSPLRSVWQSSFSACLAARVVPVVPLRQSVDLGRSLEQRLKHGQPGEF